MRFSMSAILVAALFAVFAESARADIVATYKAHVLRYSFECDPGALHHELQNYFDASAPDDEWSSRAETQLSAWFAPDQGSSKVEVTCMAELCAVDFLMSPHEFASEHRSVVYEWTATARSGYLPEGLYFPRHDGSTRLFVFRDSFDPEEL